MLSLRDFWRRHKRKLLVTAGVVGSGYCLYKVYNGYQKQLDDMERQLAEEREHDELVKAQMQSHLESIQTIADTRLYKEGRVWLLDNSSNCSLLARVSNIKKQLKDLFDVTSLRETAMQITDTFVSTGSPSRLVDYLMPEDTRLHKDAIVSSNSDSFHNTDLTKFDQLMLETRGVILSPGFGRVVEVSLKQLVSALMEDFESSETSLTTSPRLPLAKLLPQVAQMGSLLLKELSENRYVQIIQGSPEAELFFTLLYTNAPPQSPES